MAGTFPGVAGAQQNDVNGLPLDGAQLTIYQGGTTTLAALFQDIGLTLPYVQNPLTADASGRLPLFFVADGTYSVRLTDKNGVTTNGGFYWPQVPSIGASTSGGGGGSTVDPTTIFGTGDVIWIDINSTRAGWVRQNGRTVGSATSGASERANADCQALFLYLWNNFTDAKCPVISGRGASAAADWAANKQITLRDRRGRAAFGLDGMGNIRANIIPDTLVSGGDTADTQGAIGGEANHTLVTAEMPVHNHALTDPGHTHAQESGTVLNHAPNILNLGGGPNGNSNASSTAPAVTGITLAPAGGGTAHNNMPGFELGTFFQKL